MGSRPIAAALVLCLLLAPGCSKTTNVIAPTPPAGTGSLFVRVVDSANQVVPGAVVMLKPTARADTTDALGTALIEGLAGGTYTVLATRQPLGSGKTVVTVKSSEVTRVDVSLVAGVTFEPSVWIDRTGLASEYSYVDTVRFHGNVFDLEDRASSLKLTWRSSHDGVLSTAPARADGVSLLSTDALSLGTHWIALYAVDSDGRVGADSIQLSIRSFPPAVTITAPPYPASFTPGEPITVSAAVADRETRTESLSVEWSSSLDGALGSGPPSVAGVASITRSTLSAGNHWIRLIVTDHDGNASRDSVEIHNVLPAPISLDPPLVASGRVGLRWTPALAAGFDRYEVYRATSAGILRSGTPLHVTTSAADTAWVDSLPPFATQVYYRVFVVNTWGYDRGSEERVASSPGGLILTAVAVDDAVLHPTQPWVYLHERSTGKITIVDYRAMTVLRSVTLGGYNGFLDLSDNGYGLELLVPRPDGWVQVRNAEDLSLITSINTGLPNACALGDGGGSIFVSMVPSPWWERPLRSYRRSDGSYVDGNGDFDDCRLRLLPGGSEIIEITMSVSPIDMDWYRLAPDGHILSHRDDLQHGDYPLDPYLYRVSPAQSYLVTSSQGAVYRADSTMTYLGLLPRGSLTFGDFAFSDDGSRIYAGCSNEKLVKIHDYPTLGDLGYLQTRGYPRFLWRVGNELLSLSRTTPASYYYDTYDLGIEVLAIPAAIPGRYAHQNRIRAAGPVQRAAVTLRAAPAGH